MSVLLVIFGKNSAYPLPLISFLIHSKVSYGLGKRFFSGEDAAYERMEAQLMGTSLRICGIVHTENITPVKVCI